MLPKPYTADELAEATADELAEVIGALVNE